VGPSAATASPPSRPPAWRSGASPARSPPAPPAASCCATITAAPSWPTTFQHQLRFWGLAPSHAFVAEPETNGVAERFFRTPKEQIVHGRVYRTIGEVRAAVRALIDRYNAAWLIEKNGLRSPLAARAAWERELTRAAA
jgi:hypothetical protein